jgi:NhaP-type Na+/H+ or K+/H+ antiporter
MLNQPEVILAAFLLLAALVTGLARLFGRWYFSMPMIFVLAGIIMGPAITGLVNLQPDTESVQLLAELTLALILFTDASSLSLRQVSDDANLPLRLLSIALPLIIVCGAVVGWLLYPELPVGYALLVATILAPTDAALGLPIYSNPRMPVRIRRALNIESGLNDGIASPFVILFLGLTLAEERILLGDWLQEALLELGLAILIGALAGYILSIGIGGNGFVAAFIGGIIFGHASKHKLAEQTEFAEAAGTLLSLLVWTVFAVVLISPQWFLNAPTGDILRAIFYAILSLTVVRMLPVAVSMIGTGLRRDTVLLMGWFGPRGLASVVFGLLATGAFEEAGRTMQPMALLVTLTVTISVFAHGFSARPIVNWYSGRLDDAEEDHIELAEMPELPARRRLT